MRASVWWQVIATVNSTATAVVSLVERTLPAWLFVTVQTIFVVSTTVVLFVLAVGIAWALLWKLVLSKIHFFVALKNELLLGQPSMPRRRHVS